MSLEGSRSMRGPGGIYARISSDREGDNLAIGRQLADCEALADRRGWTVVERYVDSDISAYSGKRRPEYLRMLEDIDAGVDRGGGRLPRRPVAPASARVGGLHRPVRAHKTKLATVSGDLDLSTHEGQLLARITGAVARKESDDKSRRIRRKHEELALRRQGFRWRDPPVRYEADKRTVRPDEAEVIRELRAPRARGRLAARALQGLERARGGDRDGAGEWRPQTLRRMLMSARISGQREHKGRSSRRRSGRRSSRRGRRSSCARSSATPTGAPTGRPRRYLLARVAALLAIAATQLYSRPRADGAAAMCARMARLRRLWQDHGHGRPGGGVSGRRRCCTGSSRPSSPERSARAPDGAGGGGVAGRDRATQAQLDELAPHVGDQGDHAREWLNARPPIEKRLTVAKKRARRAQPARPRCCRSSVTRPSCASSGRR